MIKKLLLYGHVLMLGENAIISLSIMRFTWSVSSENCKIANKMHENQKFGHDWSYVQDMRAFDL